MAAGPWYSGSGLGDANVALAAKTIEVALHESEKNQEAMAHPVIMDILARDEGLGDLMGALGVGISFADIGQGKQSAVAEGTEATPANFDEAAISITPARRAYARKLSDYARSLQGSLLRGELAPDAYAMLVYEGTRVWGNSIVDELLAYASSATNSVGTSGAALTWSALQNGVYDFKDRGAGTGRMLCLMTAKGVKDLATDAMSLGGAVQMSAQVQQFISNGAQGSYVGSFFGGAVDIHINSECDTSGGDTLGLIIGMGGLQTKHQKVPLGRSADVLSDVGFFTQEIRRPGGGVDIVETVSYRGSAIREQGRIAQVIYAT
jgi:hypothetical protein